MGASRSTAGAERAAPVQTRTAEARARGRWPWALACGVAVLGLLLAHRAVAAQVATITGPLVPLARLFDLLLLGGALLLGHAVGARLLRALGLALAPAEPVAGAVYATALGLGALAYAALALGLVGLYRAPVLLAGVLLLAVLLRRDLAASGAGLLALARRARRGGVQGIPRGVPALAALLTFGALLALAGALTPPHHYDPLAYHLLGPQRYLATGWIRPLEEIVYANLPLTVELLYGVGLAFGSEVFGQLLHLAFGGLTAAALWALARRHFDAPTASLALAVFLSTPLVVVWARVANIDLALTLYLLLMVMATLRATSDERRATSEEPDPGEAAASHTTASGSTFVARRSSLAARRWLALAGAFAGLALATKYQALFAVPLLAVVLLVDGLLFRRRGGRGALADVGVFLGVAVLVGSPWYARNWLQLGNPVWPLFVGGRGFGPLAVELVDYFARGMALSPRTPLGYLLLPLRAYTRGSIEQTLAILSPLYLLLPALLVLPRQRELVYLLVPAAGLAVGWALGFQELRYLLPLCPALSLAAAYALRAARERPLLRRLVLPALAMAALLTAFVVFLHVGADRPVAVLLGRESRDAYLRRSVAVGATYRATSFLAERARPGDTIVLFNDAQLYYAPPDAAHWRPDHLDMALLALTEPHPTPEAMLAALRAEGVDYLLVNEGNIRYRRRFDPEGRLARGAEAFARLTPLLDPIYRDSPADRPSILVYRVPEGH